MRRKAASLGVLILLLLSTLSARAQQESNWFVTFDLGEGQLQYTTDQAKGSRTPTFALAFSGGHRLTNQARVGLQVGGYLMEASNLNDPTKGVSVSHVFGFVDVFPVRRKGFFVRGGGGLAMYDNNHPLTNGSHGAGWMAGAGYEIPIAGDSFKIAPMVVYSAGTLGSSSTSFPPETNRRYSAIEFKASIIWKFGKRHGK